MSRKTVALAVLTAIIAFSLNAEDATLSISLDDVKINWTAVPTGLVFKFGYGPMCLLPGLRTAVEAKLGAGYENYGISRSDITGDPLRVGDASMPSIDKPNAQWELGLRQGLLPLEEKRDFLAVWVSIHGRLDLNFGDQVISIFNDRNTAFIHSLLGGLSLDNSVRNAHGVFSGLSLGLEGEWGPAFLSLEGTDFLRAKAEATAFLPLFDIEAENNLLSSYMVFRLNAKYIRGDRVPLFMLEGSDVRAYPLKLDTRFRAYGAMEARLNLPSLVGTASLLPTLFAFCDSGYYRGYNNLDLDLDGSSPWLGATGKESSGFLLSAGGGFEFDVFQFAQLVLSAGVPLCDADSLGVNLSDMNRFWFSVDLSMHLK